MFNSPLRYPGGKNKLSAFIANICVNNNINGHYIEPYAGGASVALFLLLEGFVRRITINDKDRSIYAFWFSVLNHHEELCNLIENTDINRINWEIQREVQKNKENANLLQLGFSTLFMNRTNRSGIITAGMIGGVDQCGEYKMDCRFNKLEIINRIKLIARNNANIELYNLDAIELINKIEMEEPFPENSIFYFDPPYYLKGSSLYMNHYKKNNHKDLSDRIQLIENFKWVVSYDNQLQIKNLYSEFHKKEYEFKHTAYNSREGQEILFFSPNIVRPNIENWNPLEFKYRKKNKKDKLVYIPKKVEITLP